MIFREDQRDNLDRQRGETPTTSFAVDRASPLTRILGYHEDIDPRTYRAAERLPEGSDPPPLTAVVMAQPTGEDSPALRIRLNPSPERLREFLQIGWRRQPNADGVGSRERPSEQGPMTGVELIEGSAEDRNPIPMRHASSLSGGSPRRLGAPETRSSHTRSRSDFFSTARPCRVLRGTPCCTYLGRAHRPGHRPCSGGGQRPSFHEVNLRSGYGCSALPKGAEHGSSCAAHDGGPSHPHPVRALPRLPGAGP